MWNHELSYVWPEIFLVAMACIILILDLFTWRYSKWVTYLLCQFTLLGTLCLTWPYFGQERTTVFSGLFTLDDIGSRLKAFIEILGVIVLLYSRRYIFEREVYRGEYFILCLFSIFGMMVLISSLHFLTLYLGIELLALPLYALITMDKESRLAPEAAMKYFVMGALASGLLLYGISLLYGVTGSFDLLVIAEHLSKQPIDNPNITLLFGLVFILTGLAFKFGAVPFHMWLPDVYQGAPLPVTLFIGTLSKVAALGFALRLLMDAFPAFHIHWQPLILIMAILSLIIGNVVAIVQNNLKRLLGYSTIAHIGFVFLGLLAGPESGYLAAINYVVIYVIMALGAFGIMLALSYQGFEAENIVDFRGLGQRQPWTAFLMLLLLFSLAGVPPLAGFYAKLFVLDAVIKAGFLWPAVLAVLLTVVGAFYYLKIVKVMFFEEPLENVFFNQISKSGTVILSLNALALLVLGFFPMYFLKG